MSKVLTLLVALALFAAIPAVASAQGTSPSGGGDIVSSGNSQDGDIDQDAEAGGGDGTGDGHGGNGGNAGNQACLIQQNAGRDANAACNQEQNFSSSARHVGGHHVNRVHDNDVDGVGVTGVGGGVQSVALARTGFDAWMLALIGGIALAGGLGLLAVQRRQNA
jgi:LPXTG-motif cell wall-anchored protein